MVATKKTSKGVELLNRTLRLHRSQLDRLIERRGVRGIRSLYEDAKDELAARLVRAGPKSDKVGPSVLRAMQAQVESVLSAAGKNLRDHLVDVGGEVTEMGARHALAEYKRLADHFEGTEPTLDLDRAAVFRGMVADVDSSLLRRYERQSQTWTLQAIDTIERNLSVAVLTGKPLEETVDELMTTHGLEDGERYRAERVIRTESVYAHGTAKYEAMSRTSDEMVEDGEKPLMKKLFETFDDRTGDDSLIIHGQAVPIDEPFSWKRKTKGGWILETFMFPPNRPNDRGTVIPWSEDWDEDELDRALTIDELESAEPTRWRKIAGVEVPPGHVPGEPYSS